MLTESMFEGEPRRQKALIAFADAGAVTAAVGVAWLVHKPFGDSCPLKPGGWTAIAVGLFGLVAIWILDRVPNGFLPDAPRPHGRIVCDYQGGLHHLGGCPDSKLFRPSGAFTADRCDGVSAECALRRNRARANAPFNEVLLRASGRDDPLVVAGANPIGCCGRDWVEPGSNPRFTVRRWDSHREAWNNLTNADNGATLYHDERWLQALEQAYGFEIVIAAIADGCASAACLLARTKNPFKPRLVALPFSDTCAPLASDPSAIPPLLEAISARASARGGCELRGIAAPPPWQRVDCFDEWMVGSPRSARCPTGAPLRREFPPAGSARHRKRPVGALRFRASRTFTTSTA